MSDELGYPDFALLSEQLKPIDPAEMHGMLCGMLCVAPNLTDSTWLERIIDDLPPGGLNWDIQQALLAIYQITWSQLHADDFRFTLWLPDDETSLNWRLAGFRRWCQSFLSGLGAGGMDKHWALSDEVQEFLNDLLILAQSIEDEPEAADEDNEQDYLELVEYVRMGVLLMHQDISAMLAQSNH